MLCWTGKKEDRLRLKVFDSDFSNEDDFMGGASISLEGILDDADAKDEGKGTFIEIPLDSTITSKTHSDLDSEDLPKHEYKALAVAAGKATNAGAKTAAAGVGVATGLSFSGILSQVTGAEEKGKLYCRLVWVAIDS